VEKLQRLKLIIQLFLRKNKMSNYKIITDEQKLIEFIDYLPDLNRHETYYLCLFARNKYCKHVKHISSDKAQLKRFVTNKERMFNKIKQLEIEIDNYYQFRNGDKVIIPQEALALYININPRSQRKAIVPTIEKYLKLYDTGDSGYNIVQEAISCIQKSKSRNCFFNVDFDVEKECIDKIKQELALILNVEAYDIVETRGGFHVLVKIAEIKEQFIKNWYLNMTILGPEMLKDSMLPVVGCYQGGFTPKFISNV